ncbi:MAG: transglutaminase family protein [Rhodocyclaceae bacterium]
MRYRIEHLTTYTYEEPVGLSYQIAHLRPLDTPWQRCHSHTLDVTPTPQARGEGEDYFGNAVCRFELAKPHAKLRILARSEVDVTRGAAPHIDAIEWEEAARHFDQPILALPDERAASEFVFDSPHAPVSEGALAFAARHFTPGRPLLKAVDSLMHAIHDEFEYDPDATHIGTPVEELLSLGRGVCQDFAHLMIAAIRAMGLPARYVSGYLLTAPPPGQARLVGADASHAWVSVFVPGTGWLEFDPTNAVRPGDEHIVLAYGRDFADVSPLRGVILGGGSHELDVAVTVTPLP